MAEARGRAALTAALLPLLALLQSAAFVPFAAGAGAETCAAVDSLGRLVDFFSRNVDHFDADGYSGLSIASLAIRSEPLTMAAIAQECSESQAVEFARAMAQLDHLLRAFRSRFPSPAASGKTYDSITYWEICRPIDAILKRRLRAGVFHWRWLKDRHDRRDSRAPGSLESADAWVKSNFMKIVSYKESVGDLCFREMFKMERGRCSISPMCKNFFLGSRYLFGYGLAHQFDYWLATIENSCQEKLSDGTPVDWSLLDDTCRRSYSEYAKILRSSYASSNGVLFDVALEHAVLCGAYGFRDFFADSTVLLLRRLQSERLGCFTYDRASAAKIFGVRTAEAGAAVSPAMEKSKATGRKLLHDVLLEGSCSSHTSGLATAYLALYLRP